MTVPAIYKFINWITGTPVPIDDAMTSALTPTVDAALAAALNLYITTNVAREKLTANRSYFVATTGSDSNDGLTAGSPFLTPQKAMDVIKTLDVSTFTVTVNISDGTYTGGVNIYPWVGSGTIKFVGNSGTPANVVMSCTSRNCFDHITGPLPGIFEINGMKLQTTTSGFGINAAQPGRIQYTNIDFGASGGGVDIVVQNQGFVTGYGNNKISNGKAIHAFTTTFGLLVWTMSDVGGTIAYDCTANPNFTFTFLYCSGTGGVNAPSPAFSYTGAPTGSRFIVNSVSNINVNGGGANYFPGNVAGTADAATFGHYA